MKTINLYVCDVCGKESRVLDTLTKHETACKRAKALEEKREREYLTLRDEFCERFTLENAADCINWFVGEMFDDHFPEIKIKVRYEECASNSHEAPMGGVTNWHHTNDLPRGYPGFTGSIGGIYSKKGKTISQYCGSFGRKYSMPISTGTGGGDSKTWGYGVTFWVDDFPDLQVKCAKRLLEEV